ncbi:hypothetical protein QMS56_18735 [Cronobacter malonaticus]|mgnify:CR=1 FL=1|nr:hypothetical protein [Cronobacter malonaticus]MDK1258637.1 hypothetical protein [Cronobacter malonaticus]MDK1319934.1 hypothetical protein [Cronobacter malonaticus]
MYRLTTFITTLLLSVAASADVGFHQFTIDSPATRPLDAAVWYLAHALPGKFARAISVPGATHFSFMQLCKPGAAAVIDAQEPGEGIVCRDGAGFSREKIHQQLTTQISEFLNQTLRYQPPRGDIPPDSSPQSAKTRD